MYKRARFEMISIDRCQPELIAFNIFAYMFQWSISISFAGEIDKLWPHKDMDHLKYWEKIGQQISVVFIRYFDFCWLDNNNRGPGAFNKLSFKDMLHVACCVTSDYVLLVKNKLRPIEEVVAIMCRYHSLPGRAPETLVQHNRNEQFFKSHLD